MNSAVEFQWRHVSSSSVLPLTRSTQKPFEKLAPEFGRPKPKFICTIVLNILAQLVWPCLQTCRKRRLHLCLNSWWQSLRKCQSAILPDKQGLTFVRTLRVVLRTISVGIKQNSGRFKGGINNTDNDRMENGLKAENGGKKPGQNIKNGPQPGMSETGAIFGSCPFRADGHFLFFLAFSAFRPAFLSIPNRLAHKLKSLFDLCDFVFHFESAGLGA